MSTTTFITCGISLVALIQTYFMSSSSMVLVSAFSNSASQLYHSTPHRSQSRVSIASSAKPLPFFYQTSYTIEQHNKRQYHESKLCMSSNDDDSDSASSKFEKVDAEDDQVIAFVDTTGENGIDCYIDSYATVEGVEYCIGSPCDYAVALCYFGDGGDDDEQLVPIELDDPLMDELFPIAEGIIEDEFGEELVLLKTPQTLTLVGELEEDDDEDEDDIGDIGDTEEEVEILISFEEDGQEYHLVRLLDPVLLVGKNGKENTRILLTPEQSDVVMPQLESMFMSYQEESGEAF